MDVLTLEVAVGRVPHLSVYIFIYLPMYNIYLLILLYLFIYLSVPSFPLRREFPRALRAPRYGFCEYSTVIATRAHYAVGPRQ